MDERWVSLVVGARAMIRRVAKTVALVAAIVLLIAAGVTPFIPFLAAVVAAGGELRCMADTGLPASVELLNWTDWQDGAGALCASEWAPHPLRLRDAKIAAYRVGQANGIITKFTFYQARYILTDGTEVIAPAKGPELLISARPTMVVTIVLLFLISSVGLFIFGART